MSLTYLVPDWQLCIVFWCDIASSCVLGWWASFRCWLSSTCAASLHLDSKGRGQVQCYISFSLIARVHFTHLTPCLSCCLHLSSISTCDVSQTKQRGISLNTLSIQQLTQNTSQLSRIHYNNDPTHSSNRTAVTIITPTNDIIPSTTDRSSSKRIHRQFLLQRHRNIHQRYRFPQ